MKPGLKRIMTMLVVAMTVLALAHVTPLADARHHSGHGGHSGYHHYGYGHHHGHHGYHAGSGHRGYHSGGDRHKGHYSSRWWRHYSGQGTHDKGYYSGRSGHRGYHTDRGKRDRGYDRDRSASTHVGGYDRDRIKSRSDRHRPDGGTRRWDRHRDRHYNWWIGYGPGAYERGYYWPSRSYDRYRWWSDYRPYRGTYDGGYYWPSRGYDRPYDRWREPIPETGTWVGSGPPPVIGSAPPPLDCTVNKERIVPNPKVSMVDLESKTIELKRPADVDLVPYYERRFIPPYTRGVTWWMLKENLPLTNDFRKYLRKDAYNKSLYSKWDQRYYNDLTGKLDNAIAVSRLHDDQRLYRGIDTGFANFLLKQSWFDENAISSTTYDPSISIKGYTGDSQSCNYANILVIDYPAGGKTLFIDDTEREFMLPRGTTWDVTKVENVDHLTLQSDFPLSSSKQNVDKFDRVRFIYITPRAAA